MNDRVKKIQKFYERSFDFEKKRLDLYPIEFSVTLNSILNNSKVDSIILDAACGAGKYAVELLNHGRRVFINDISMNLLSIADAQVSKISGYLGSSSLDIFCDESWIQFPKSNIILLLGPFCHLGDKINRVSVLNNAKASLMADVNTDDGKNWIYVSYLSLGSAFWYALENSPEVIHNIRDKKIDIALSDLSWTATQGIESEVEWFFATPDKIISDFNQSGIELIEILGLEGLLGRQIHSVRGISNDKTKEAWLKFAKDTVSNQAAMWCSEHLLAIGCV